MMRIQWVAEQEEPELHQMIADLPVRTFFLNDVAPAAQDIGNLRELDQDLSGTIEHAELAGMRCEAVSSSPLQPHVARMSFRPRANQVLPPGVQ